jgi:hypothetical protein
MTSAAARHWEGRRQGLASRLVVLLAVLAFAFQSYVTQTHIHDDLPQSSFIVKAVGDAPAHGKKAPLNPASCPFCQSVALAGAFVSPTNVLFHLPLAWVLSVAHVFTARATSATIAHDWQSRAPPRV